MTNIYELTAEYKNLHQVLNEAFAGEEIDEECIANTLSTLTDDIKTRCINISKSIKNREANIAGYKQREEEIKTRLKQLTNKRKREQDIVDYLSSLVDVGLQALDDEISTPDFRIRKVGKKPSVEVLNERDVPIEYMSKEVSYSVDKIKSYKALADGKDIPGLKLGERERLEIK